MYCGRSSVFVVLAACFLLVARLAFTSTLKMEAASSSEMSVNACQTTWYHIPKDSTLRRQIYLLFTGEISVEISTGKFRNFPLL
jgi:hypothetical protein